jgi:hypothetical protein
VVQRGEVLEVLARRELPVEAALAGEDRAQPASDIPRAAHEIVAQHGRRAGRGLEERRQHAHRGRLAGAVRSKDPEHLARLDAEVDAVDCPEGLALVGLAAQPLPDRAAALLEVLGEADCLDCCAHLIPR